MSDDDYLTEEEDDDLHKRMNEERKNRNNISLYTPENYDLISDIPDEQQLEYKGNLSLKNLEYRHLIEDILPDLPYDQTNMDEFEEIYNDEFHKQKIYYENKINKMKKQSANYYLEMTIQLKISNIKFYESIIKQMRKTNVRTLEIRTFLEDQTKLKAQLAVLQHIEKNLNISKKNSKKYSVQVYNKKSTTKKKKILLREKHNTKHQVRRSNDS